MKNYVAFNLNNEILVKLTPDGFKHWMLYCAEQRRSLKATWPWMTLAEPQPLSYYLDKRDKEGFVAIQGWQFVQIFGPVTGFGSKYFYAGIRMAAEEVEPVTVCE